MVLEMGEWRESVNGPTYSPKYTITAEHNSDKIILTRNCNSHTHGACIQEECSTVELGNTYYIRAVRNNGYGGYRDGITLSDEGMQELFAAYLAMRKEVGYDD